MTNIARIQEKVSQTACHSPGIYRCFLLPRIARAEIDCPPDENGHENACPNYCSPAYTTTTPPENAGDEIVNVQLPDRSKFKERCFRKARCFGGFRLEGRDLALTGCSPVPVELDCSGAIASPQVLTSGELLYGSIDHVSEDIGVYP